MLLVDVGIWEGLSDEDKRMVKRSRVWLSAAIDCATRYILGLRLLIKDPSAESALACLELAVIDKSDIGAAVGTITPWSGGRPECVTTDAGAAFISAAFKSAVQDLGSESHNPPAGVPQLRGTIERVFRTFQEHFLTFFPGQTFQNVVRKGEYDSEGQACIDIEELNRTLIRYVVDVYHNVPHDGLAGETPHHAWLRLTQKYPVLPPPNSIERRHIFGIPCARRIGNRGIRILGLHYQSADLQRVRHAVGQLPMQVRVDRFDLGSISVRTEQGWLSVRKAAEDLNLDGVTYWEWVAAIRELRRRNADIASLSAKTVNQAIDAIRATADMAIARAELGSPILTQKDINKLDQELFRYAVGTSSEDVDETLFDDEPEEVQTVIQAAPIVTQTTPIHVEQLDDAPQSQFGSTFITEEE